jgi:hypothetical protein
VKQSTSDIKSVKTNEVQKILAPSKQLHELTLSKHTIHRIQNYRFTFTCFVVETCTSKLKVKNLITL